MKLSIIIPAHNEEKTIAQVLDKVFSVDLGDWEKEVVIVNDGSSDGTGVAIKQWASLQGNDAHCMVLHHQTNLGKGAAIQTALKNAMGDYVIIQDADLEYEPKDIPKLLSEIQNNLSPGSSPGQALNPSPQEGREIGNPSPLKERGRGEVAVFGNRGTKSYPERGFHYVLGAKLLTWAFNLLFWQKVSDLYVGYKLITTADFKALNIKSTGFEFEAEVACKLAKRGVNIKEVNISYYPRSKEHGKHIGWIDAVRGFLRIIKERFNG